MIVWVRRQNVSLGVMQEATRISKNWEIGKFKDYNRLVLYESGGSLSF
jgi:hypothetical protein